MCKAVIILLSLIVCGYDAVCSDEKIILSENSSVSLLICSPGKELYSAFGHCAVRINDPVLGMDISFSYGAFDFGQFNFYMNFLKGRLTFLLVIERTEDFIYGYKVESRTIDELILDIPTELKQSVFDFLLWNAQAENREYDYDFFRNNCASKIRDVFVSTVGIRLNYSSDLEYPKGISKREMLDRYLQDMPWSRFAFYLLLGLPADSILPPFHQTFLPDYLEVAFLHGKNKINSPLCAGKARLLEKSPTVLQTNHWQNPNLILPIAVALLFGIGFFLGKNGMKASILIFSLIIGFLGLMLLWLLPNHQLTYKNLNLLWTLPANVFVIVFLQKIKNVSALSLIIKYYGVFLILTCIALYLLPQVIHTAIYLSLLVAGGSMLFFSKKLHS